MTNHPRSRPSLSLSVVGENTELVHCTITGRCLHASQTFSTYTLSCDCTDCSLQWTYRSQVPNRGALQIQDRSCKHVLRFRGTGPIQCKLRSRSHKHKNMADYRRNFLLSVLLNEIDSSLGIGQQFENTTLNLTLTHALVMTLTLTPVPNTNPYPIAIPHSAFYHTSAQLPSCDVDLLTISHLWAY